MNAILLTKGAYGIISPGAVRRGVFFKGQHRDIPVLSVYDEKKTVEIIIKISKAFIYRT